jgi:hypothetical protein
MINDWGNIERAKVLVIGHDPRLQRSDTIADYAFFANHYTEKPKPSRANKSKYNLAKSTFHQIFDLTNNLYQVNDFYITNLCNEELPHAPKGKTVYIPEEVAKAGLDRIKSLLIRGNIEIVFPTSLQVNYWLQKLGFYQSPNDEFILKAEPKQIGVNNSPPYYVPNKEKAFQIICGSIFNSFNNKHKVIPILHPKTYSFISNFNEVYGPKYEAIRSTFLNEIQLP